MTFDDGSKLNTKLQDNLQKVRSDFDQYPKTIKAPPHQMSDSFINTFIESRTMTFNDLENQEEQEQYETQIPSIRLSALNAAYRRAMITMYQVMV